MDARGGTLRPVFSLAAHTTDDRGRRVTVFTARGQPAARFEADPGLADLMRRINASRIELGKPLNSLDLGIGIAIGFVFLGAFAGKFLGGSSWATFGLFFACALLMVPAIQQNSNRLVAKRTRATLLREGRCPSCAYPIATLPAEPDGRITCPECSAAWDRAAVAERVPSPDGHRGNPGPAVEARADAVDALGRAVPLRDPLLRDLEPGRAAEIGPDRLAEIRIDVLQRVRRRKFSGVAAWLFVCLLATGPQLAVIAAVGGWASLLPAAVGLLMTAVFVFQAYLVATYRSRWSALPAARVLIEHGLCPSCAGDLEPSPESLLTCRACRAAWKPTGP